MGGSGKKLFSCAPRAPRPRWRCLQRAGAVWGGQEKLSKKLFSWRSTRHALGGVGFRADKKRRVHECWRRPGSGRWEGGGVQTSGRYNLSNNCEYNNSTRTCTCAGPSTSAPTRAQRTRKKHLRNQRPPARRALRSWAAQHKTSVRRTSRKRPRPSRAPQEVTR